MQSIGAFMNFYRNQNDPGDIFLKALGQLFYPVTIIRDRYDGAFSGGRWLVFGIDYDEIPEEIGSGDYDEESFWKIEYPKWKGQRLLPIGVGITPEVAAQDFLAGCFMLVDQYGIETFSHGVQNAYRAFQVGFREDETLQEPIVHYPVWNRETSQFVYEQGSCGFGGYVVETAVIPISDGSISYFDSKPEKK